MKCTLMDTAVQWNSTSVVNCGKLRKLQKLQKEETMTLKLFPTQLLKLIMLDAIRLKRDTMKEV